MVEKEMVGVRLPKDTLERIEEYAERQDISKSDALRRMIERGVDLEEAGLTVAASQSGEPMSDGAPTAEEYVSLRAEFHQFQQDASLLIGGFVVALLGLMASFAVSGPIGTLAAGVTVVVLLFVGSFVLSRWYHDRE